ncbi:MAG TPA: hypothetical protein VLH15_10685 [Dehalococcoidales bacterium]|nr:hypothetical protein [Dehalococcoidales bacterium]
MNFYQRSLTKYSIIITGLLILFAAMSCSNTQSSNSRVNSSVINFRHFDLNAQTVGLRTSAKGTIFVEGDIKKSDKRSVKILASIEIDPDDWGGVTFYTPQEWKVTNFDTDYPQGNPHPEKYASIWNEGGSTKAMICISTYLRTPQTGGGGGNVILQLEPASQEQKLPENLEIGVGIGSKGDKSGGGIVGPISIIISIPLHIDYRNQN